MLADCKSELLLSITLAPANIKYLAGMQISIIIYCTAINNYCNIVNLSV